jgi:hypothetical protein
MTWQVRDAALEAQAQAYADTCPTGHASRSARNNAGENLYWSGGQNSGDADLAYSVGIQAWCGSPLPPRANAALVLLLLQRPPLLTLLPAVTAPALLLWQVR